MPRNLLRSFDANRHDHGGQILITGLFSAKVFGNSAMIMAESPLLQRPALLDM
jgi:hypothetical protein